MNMSKLDDILSALCTLSAMWSDSDLSVLYLFSLGVAPILQVISRTNSTRITPQVQATRTTPDSVRPCLPAVSRRPWSTATLRNLRLYTYLEEYSRLLRLKHYTPTEHHTPQSSERSSSAICVLEGPPSWVSRFYSSPNPRIQFTVTRLVRSSLAGGCQFMPEGFSGAIPHP